MSQTAWSQSASALTNATNFGSFLPLVSPSPSLVEKFDCNEIFFIISVGLVFQVFILEHDMSKSIFWGLQVSER